MKLSNLFNADDRGVSPVIGVILMVAITVILAAVIGTFVLGLGSQVGNNAPQASFDWDSGNMSSVNATLQSSGSAISTSDLNVTSSQSSVNISNRGSLSDKLSAGDTLRIESVSDWNDGQKVNLVWSSDSGQSSIISSWTYNA
ncbi:hypothetical protein GCM10009037_09080 [Halarchaeum grantii]|uniref:Archaeal Type IV pilin N-terminal domain-containing protein n=1 Tax=Halarchaeum grantii TaxID=1193105 RepID=A0A830EV31_9EURY|nr:type IV pilin N-terminal domain-containing protein [Halarchaeum grantii]GGL27682.1 hypothetical protein GCM10009037_09080 [Halarchaeum grantii]